MKTFYNIQHKAIVIASDRIRAAIVLENKLEINGFDEQINIYDMIEIKNNFEHVTFV